VHDIPHVTSAIDAVRCLYLAKVTEQKGHPDAAQRWREMADKWLKNIDRDAHGRGDLGGGVG